MPVIKITAADVKKGEVIEAKWYGAKIVKIDDPKPSADAKSVNIVYWFLIEGSGGKEVAHNFNSKGWIQMPELQESISLAKINLKEGEEFTFNTDDHLMKQVDVLLYVDNYNGRLSNKVKNFLPYGKGTTQVLPF